MKVIWLALAVIALVTFETPVLSQNFDVPDDWVKIGKNENNERLDFDLYTLQRVENRIAVWERLLPAGDKSIDPNNSKKIYQIRTRNLYNCESKTFSTLSISRYFEDTIQTEYVPKNRRKEYAVISGGLQEALFIEVCKARTVFDSTNWMRFHTTSTGTDIYYHTRIRRSGLRISAMGRIDLITVYLKYDHRGDKTVKYRETRALDRYNCGDRPYVQTLASVRLYDDGQTDPILDRTDLATNVYGRTVYGRIVVREPLADKMLRMLCLKRAPGP